MLRVLIRKTVDELLWGRLGWEGNDRRIMLALTMRTFGHGKATRLASLDPGATSWELNSSELLSIKLFIDSPSRRRKGSTNILFTIQSRLPAPIICLLIYPRNHLQVVVVLLWRISLYAVEKQLKKFSEHVIFPVSLDKAVRQ